MAAVIPYGSWPSPIGADLTAAAAVGLSGGWCDGGDLYWLRSDPAQKGRTTLIRSRHEATADLTPDHNVRSSVHSYGGGAAAAAAGIVVYTDYSSGQVFCLEGSGPARAIAPGGAFRYAGFAFAPGRREVACVREESSPTGDIDSLVVLDLDSDNLGGGRRLAFGADFYHPPQIAPDGRTAWVEWDQPDMPWDSTRLCLGSLDGGPARLVAGGPGVSVLHPSWAPDGSLVFLTDISGHWNFARWDGVRLSAPPALPYDFCDPPWVLGPPPYALLPDGSIGCSWLDGGRARLGRLRLDGRLEDFGLDLAAAEATPGFPRSLVRLGFFDRPAALAAVDWAAGQVSEVVSGGAGDLDPGFLSRPQAFDWTGPDGPVHAWFYPPTNPNCVAPAGQLPPLVVLCHGGPTAYAAPEFSYKRLFWTSRGLGLLCVNYGGSAGYGRAYRERLKGRWGLVDVRDCADGAVALAAAGLADPARLAIQGGSAGGYTALAALCFTDVFAAGISLYGIGDLEAMAQEGCKFEARYLDGLVAPYPAGRQTYRDRSPICHLDSLDRPLILFQGQEDKVVPPEQSVALAAAVEAKGRPAVLVLYPGEGHGFRLAATIQDQHERSERFLAQVFGYELPVS
ncbi:MAG: prolyl oligopeptidase family serine peptidase [Propionibacteriaceae bacterium]|nr:prolyl oligopeptidase family serine peptidase [Propionibacteriaceae bacterium]